MTERLNNSSNNKQEILKVAREKRHRDTRMTADSSSESMHVGRKWDRTLKALKEIRYHTSAVSPETLSFRN